jgi:hypothetical protein
MKADALQVVGQILEEYVRIKLKYDYDTEQELLASLPALQELIDRLPPGLNLRRASAQEWQEALIRYLAERITAGWDRCGAPSAARQPDGQFAASFERPGPEFTTSAESKREAYQAARREWIARILQRSEPSAGR